MTSAREHVGTVTEQLGIRFVDRAGWQRALKSKVGKEVRVRVTLVGHEKPTKDQFGYYFSTILPLACEEWGWGDPKELHIAFKWKHLPALVPVESWPAHRIGAELVVVPPSMADLSVDVASAFMQKVIDQMQDSGINVPPPRGKEA